MKIAIDVSQMCYVGTGVARYMYGLTEALLQSGSHHQFVLYAGTLRQRSFFTNLAGTPPWNHAEWKIIPVPPVLAGIALNNVPIPFEYLTGSVDLIHTSDWSEPHSSLPLVTTVHDLVFEKYPETVNALIRATQKRRLARLSKNTTHIIADSESTKNDLMEIYGMKKSRITVIYPGFDEVYTPASKSEIDRVKKKYKLPNQFVLSVGKQEPRKNMTRLVKAMEGVDMPLVVIGIHGWGEKTQTLGYVPDSDLGAIYSAASVFAFPSLYEGFGFPVLEAMACGTPVVTSNISSLPEVAGEAAILVDPTSVEAIQHGIKQAIKSHNVLIPLGLKQAQKFTWDKAAKQVLEVYDKITYRG